MIARPKEIYDGAIPSGNGVAALNFLRLFHVTGRTEYQDKADKLLTAFAGSIEDYPAGYSFSILALQFQTGVVQEIVIAGEKNTSETAQIIKIVNKKYLPLTTILLNDPSESIRDLAPSVDGKKMQNGKVTVYLCRDFSCQAPVTDVDDLTTLLDSQ